MTHSQAWIIIGTASFAATFGVFVAIRRINYYTTTPVNTLVRRGDIELGDYIEPVRGQQTYNYTDLLAQPSPIHERIHDYGRVPSYFSGGNPPSYYSYQPIDRWNINSSLEDSINPDYILISFILGVLFIILVKYYILNTNSHMVFTKGISTEVITFRNNYQEILSSKLNKGDRGFFLNYGEIQNLILKHGWSEEDIKVWLDSLNDQDYNVTIEILSDLSAIHTEWRLFSKEFVINYNSNHILIALLINDQLVNLYNLIDIDSNYTVVIHYVPLTRTDFTFIESYYIKRERR